MRHIYSVTEKRSIFMASKLCEQLNDREWLIDHYVTKGLSTKKIMALLGVKTANSVRQSLLRAEIPLRTISDGLTHNRKDDGLVLKEDVLTGCLLGDGFLRCYNKHSNGSFPYFSKRNKHRDHVDFVARCILPEQWQNYVETKLEGEYTLSILRTLSHKELLPLYRSWYPEENGFKKIIPMNIEINETVLLHWFLDDGSSYLRKRKTQQIVITFSSESFSKQDQQTLCDRVMNRFPLTPTVHPCNSGTGWRITIPQSQASRFFEIIGPPPVASLSYKWK